MIPGVVVLMLLGIGWGNIEAPVKLEEGRDLFNDVVDSDVLANAAIAEDSEAPIDPTIVRSRLVNIAWDILTVAEDSSRSKIISSDVLLLNLFEDRSITAKFDNGQARSENHFIWNGHIEGIEESQVTIVVQDDVMVGNIRASGESYQVRYMGEGVHVIREIDERFFPSEGEPISVDNPSQGFDSFLSPAELQGETGADSGFTLDVMVVYTPAARLAAGGTTAMMALADLVLAETNIAFSNSGVIPRVRLVHTEEVNYTESGSYSTDLNRLKDTADGFMDDIHTLRDTHGADMVSLFVEGGSLCGLAFTMTNPFLNTFELFAFSVVRRDCAEGNITFPHEIGHNMGLKHDRTDSPQDGVFSYSHGYVDILNSFRTIMGVFASCRPSPCPKALHFSNPAVSFGENPTGVNFLDANSADAARSLNNTAFTVANWRESVSQGLPPTLNSVSPDIGPTSGGTTVTLIGTDFVNGGTSVTFGGDAATNVNVSSGTSLTATTPAHAEGAVDVVLTTADGSATLTVAFTFTPPELSNISTRGLVQTGDSVQIGGFIIGGSDPKTVLIRARGPTLADFGVPGELPDPVLQLFSGQTMIADNDDWETTTSLCQNSGLNCRGPTEITATGLDPCVGNLTSCFLESVIYVTLNPGPYTAVVSGYAGVTGVGLIEVFGAGATSTSRLTNISTRGVVGTGDGVMIGGLIIVGADPKTVLVRARGPVLADFGVAGELNDPFLQLFSGQTVLAQNDNWQNTDPLCGAPAVSCGGQAEIVATGLDPCVGNLTGCAKESAILITLPPGAYTAIVSGINGGTGVGLVEVFEVNGGP